MSTVIALASLRTGALLGEHEPSPSRSALEDLAMTVPEIFGTLELGCLSRIAQRLGVDAGEGEQLEVLLLSESRVQVVLPLARDPELALLAISQEVGKIGLVLSQLHHHATRQVAGAGGGEP